MLPLEEGLAVTLDLVVDVLALVGVCIADMYMKD